MNSLLIRDFTNSPSYPEGGKLLYKELKSAIENCTPILLDMKDVSSLPTLFMNTSFGELMDEYGMERVKSNLRFSNITKTQIERIRKYFNDYQSILNSNKEGC